MTTAYTTEELAKLTDMPDLPEFITNRRSGALAVFQDLSQQVKPLESVITHQTSPSRAEIDFNHDDVMTLRYMFKGFGRDVRFKEIKVGKFEPVVTRCIIEDGNPNIWSVGEYNLETGKTAYYNQGIIADNLADLYTVNQIGAELPLSEEVENFAQKIENAKRTRTLHQLAAKLEKPQLMLPRQRALTIAAFLREEGLSEKVDIAAAFRSAATKKTPVEREYKPVSMHLKSTLASHVEPARILKADHVEQICNTMKAIRNLYAKEFMQVATLMVGALDEPDKLRKVAIALEGPLFVQQMVLKSEATASPAP